MTKVAICVPSSGDCKMMFTYSLCNLLGYYFLNKDDPIGIQLFMQEGSQIFENREGLVEQALETTDATHIMFIDDDMVFEPNILSIMLSRGEKIVGCNYLKRGLPLEFTALKDAFINQVVTDELMCGIERAVYMGFGCVLIDVDVFIKIEQPWFMPTYLKNSKMYIGEDYSFCHKAINAGYKIYIDHDASKLIGHCGMYTYQYKSFSKDRDWMDPDHKTRLTRVA